MSPRLFAGPTLVPGANVAKRKHGKLLVQTVSGMLSSLSLRLSSPLTSAFSRSRFSMRAWSSASSDSVTALGAILTTSWPPAD